MKITVPNNRRLSLVTLFASLVIVSTLIFCPPPLFEKVKYFPVRNEPTHGTLLLSIKGVLVIRGGYFRIVPFVFDWVPIPTLKPYLLLWPFGYSWKRSGVNLEIFDGNGQMVARVGNIVTITGGEWPKTVINTAFSPNLPEGELGPFWLVGSVN